MVQQFSAAAEGEGEAAGVARAVGALAEEFAAQRSERQRRRHLDAEDFRRLGAAGFRRTGVPVAEGGLWESVPRTTRVVAEMLRALAAGDSAVALVSAMHPAVLSFWMASPEVTPEAQAAWDEQRRRAARAALDGAWWGTITSEPGSGGDVANTRAVALPAAGDGGLAYRLSGAKHFGSGSGITSYMLTSGRPVDEAPDWFVLDVRDVPWDGSTGMRLVAEWDGHGMAATQSHGFTFQDFPAERFAWPGHLVDLQGRAGPFVGTLFTAVIAGVVDVAMATARSQLAPRRGALRAYEQVEWTEAETEAWLIRQAYEGMLRAVESDEGGTAGALSVVRGKTAIATLSERVLGRLCRILGGGTYGRGSPFGAWFEDVRALGFLRPPWGLAYDRLYDGSWPAG
ncbi:MAG TPA: acyl-CoA dehydrogenase family protein [Chloroflexota bacterium]|nr:acyl-CoA dehydrogenase family protein [Chloroflexota bacterium]